MDNISIAVLPSCEDMFICDRHASLTDPTSVGGTLRQGVSRLSSGCLDSYDRWTVTFIFGRFCCELRSGQTVR